MKRFFIGIAALCCLAAAAATVHNIDNFRNPDGTPLVVPKPQKYEAKDGVLKLPGTLTVAAPESEKIIFEYLADALKRFSCRVVPGEAAQCRFVLTSDGVPDNKEGYTLEITPDGVCVKARTTDGLFYGAVTLCNLLRNAEKPELECCRITDWPTMPYRCYTLRISNVPPENLGKLKRLIDVLAKFKFNSVFLEVGEAFPYEKEQFANAKYHHTREGMREFRDYCRARHVKIVPSLQVLSHNAWLATHADWDKMKEGNPNIPWNAQPCIQNEEARRITMNCLREQIDFFDPELFYIYTDEISHGPFRKCPRCKDVPAMTLLADYMRFLREGLKDYKGRLLFSNDSYYSGRDPRWPWGDELRRTCLDPKRDVIGYWGYGNQLKEEGIAPFKDFVTMGTCITGKPFNTYNMTKMILKYKGEGVRLTHWYFSLGGSFTSFKSETPESTGGFPHGSEYVWNFRDVYYGDLTYDGVYEMMRNLHPEMVDDATVREEARVLPLDRAVNAELSKSGMFPELDDARIAELKEILAKRPEHFSLLTAPGGRYYGMRVSGDKRDNGRQGIQFNTGNVKFKTLTLLMTASRPYNLADYLSFVVYGKKRFDTPVAAMLTLTYADGKKREIPLRYRADFTDWNQIQGGVNMRFAVRGVDLKNRYYSFGVCDLANPRPDSPVKSITFGARHCDGISPVILAASLKGANKKFNIREFDPAKMIVKPFPDFKPNVPMRTEYSFADGKIPEGVRIDVQGKLDGKATTSVVDDPERGKVLKITVPPAVANHADGFVRVNISVPFKYDGKSKGIFANVRLVAAPGDFARCMEYFHTRKITDSLSTQGRFRAYNRRGIAPDGKWAVLNGRFSGKTSEKTLKNLSGANTRRICLFFNKITQPAEVYIGDFGSFENIYDIVPEWGPDQERD